MDRLVSQLLAELDQLQATSDAAAVFVLGATNRPDLLDACLLSPGRFDRLVEVRPASDRDAKVRILRPLCRKVPLAAGLGVEQIVGGDERRRRWRQRRRTRAVLQADACPPTMSGAELAAVVSRAAMHAIRELIGAHRGALTNAKCADDDDDVEAQIDALCVRMEHIERAIAEN